MAAGVEQYTIGWVCALLPELTAARLHLDEEHHDVDFEHASGDDNTYILGTIGKHDVVIATLPRGQHGTCSAATVAKDLIRSFPNLRVILMVGIGGGVPLVKQYTDDGNAVLKFINDIRLGDVVVSAPTNGQGGVVQTDLGKALSGGEFVRTGHLNQPPKSLLTAAQLLESDFELHGQTIEADVAAKLERKPGLKRYQRPDPATDRLFNSTFTHAGPSDQDCSSVCVQHSEQLIGRPARDVEPQVHYGLIASSNTLLKDAIVRDRLGLQDNIFCVEMEAAGLMNQLPVLVIRGICDYADSHKNDLWQGYAAMTAAAYARMLLLKVALGRVVTTQRLSELSGVREQLQSISGNLKQSNVIQQELLHLQKKQNKTNLQDDLLKWFHSPWQKMDEFPQEHRKDIILGMQILIYAQEAISDEELANAISIINYNDTSTVPEPVKLLCPEVSLFTLDRQFPTNGNGPYALKPGTGIFEIIPRTLKAFVLATNKTQFATARLEGKLTPEVANAAVAVACLSCLLRDPLAVAASSYSHYSAKHWITHYRAAGVPDATMRGLAFRLLTATGPTFRSWVSRYDFPSWVTASTCRCPLFVVALNGMFALVDEMLACNDDHSKHACDAVRAASSNGHMAVAKLLLNNNLRLL